MTDEQKYDLRDCIDKMLLPLVSPYDLSDVALRNHRHKNPMFVAVSKQVFHLIADNPMTLEKVLNDMAIMAQFNKP